MRYERVKVTRDTNTVHNRAVAPWEIPVLEFIFGEENVTHLEEYEEVAGEYPDAPKELDRLVRCYGNDPKSGVPYANMAIGNAGAGVRALRKLIDDAKADDAEVAKQTRAPAPAKRSRREATAESLLS